MTLHQVDVTIPPSGINRLSEFLRRLLAEGGRTAVYVTHNVMEALALGDRVVVLFARLAQVRQSFDLRDLPRDGWQLGAELRRIEADVTAMLLLD